MAKCTFETLLRGAASPRPQAQTWATFVHAHAPAIRACDFLLVLDVFFGPFFGFVIVELATPRVVHLGATRHPSDSWTAQQLREATPFDQRPRYLIRDYDARFRATFARLAVASGIAIPRRPYRAPQASAVCDRFLDSVRRECVDHLLVLGERHPRPTLREYAAYFIRSRPHRGSRARTARDPGGGQQAPRYAGPRGARPGWSPPHV